MSQPFHRREFLGWLLKGSAVLASGIGHAHVDDTERLIASADEALTVLDFEPAAKRALLDAHYTYLSRHRGATSSFSFILGIETANRLMKKSCEAYCE